MVLTALTPVTAQGQLSGRWARRPGERWEARRASPLSPGPGAWDWSRSHGLLALCPGLTLGEILCEPARKRATAPGACRGAWGRGRRPASGTGARGGGSVTSPAGFAPSRLETMQFVLLTWFDSFCPFKKASASAGEATRTVARALPSHAVLGRGAGRCSGHRV